LWRVESEKKKTCDQLQETTEGTIFGSKRGKRHSMAGCGYKLVGKGSFLLESLGEGKNVHGLNTYRRGRTPPLKW